MKKLSVFCDESGDFGVSSDKNACYLVTMVYHDQSIDLAGVFQKYYDNGQSELSAILNAVFSMYFSDVEFRKAEQQNYRLLQVADFICSMELLNIKRKERRLSQSEEHFFYKPQELKKTFLKSIDKKRL